MDRSDTATDIVPPVTRATLDRACHYLAEQLCTVEQFTITSPTRIGTDNDIRRTAEQVRESVMAHLESAEVGKRQRRRRQSKGNVTSDPRYARLLELHAIGTTQKMIALDLGVSQPWVSMHLKKALMLIQGQGLASNSHSDKNEEQHDNCHQDQADHYEDQSEEESCHTDKEGQSEDIKEDEA